MHVSNSVVTPNKQQQVESNALLLGALGGLAACFASTCTAPIDLVKTRSQVSRSSSSLALTVKQVYAQGGVTAFYQGLSASLTRQAIYSTTRFTIYAHLKEFYSLQTRNDSWATALTVCSSLSSGAIGSLVASPFDLALVRAQAAKTVTASASSPAPSSTWFRDLRLQARSSGIRSLWTGSLPNVMRGAIVTCCQLTTHDRATHAIINHFPNSTVIPDHQFSAATSAFKSSSSTMSRSQSSSLSPFVVSFLAASLSGVVTTLLACPVDTLKARAMMQGSGGLSIRLIADWTQRKGMLGWWSGLLPYYLRVAPQVTIMLMSYDVLERWVGSME